jgi:hypothetical protein
LTGVVIVPVPKSTPFRYAVTAPVAQLISKSISMLVEENPVKNEAKDMLAIADPVQYLKYRVSEDGTRESQKNPTVVLSAL